MRFLILNPKALPRLSPLSTISCLHKQPFIKKQLQPTIHCKNTQDLASKIPSLHHIGGVLATAAVVVAQPAFAVTGENNYEQDLVWILIQSGISAFLYFIFFPPIIMNWLRKRWYKRNLLEMYLQFMCAFLFFPGVLLWAPFINFRMFPRDPAMKYPWSIPDDRSKIKGGFNKYPWAQLEDYDYE